MGKDKKIQKPLPIFCLSSISIPRNQELSSNGLQLSIYSEEEKIKCVSVQKAVVGVLLGTWYHHSVWMDLVGACTAARSSADTGILAHTSEGGDGAMQSSSEPLPGQTEPNPVTSTLRGPLHLRRKSHSQVPPAAASVPRAQLCHC